MDKSYEQLQVELKAAMQTIVKLLKDIEDYKAQIAHLEDMLKRAPLPSVSSSRRLVQATTPEQQIAIQQIERLRQASEQRSLTLEEAKLYDILVKNKRLSDDKSTANISKATYRDVDDIELMKIVGDAPNPEEENK